MKFYLTLIFFLLLAACTSFEDTTTSAAVEPVPAPTPTPTPSNIPKNIHQEYFTPVEVYFATDRQEEDKSNIKKYFGKERGQMKYGKAVVTIPIVHEPGIIESPSLWRFEFSEDPEKHIILFKIDEQNKEDFFVNLQFDRLKGSPNDNAFIYIHGYNVTFEDAAKRTAQITYDLKFNGTPIFYSWPSNGSILSYTRDEDNIEWTKAHLKTFLYDFLTKTEIENVYLIAHSMGNRALTKAYIELLNETPEFQSRIKEVILAAPDIDAQIFKDQIAPKLVKSSSNLTIYASKRDNALGISKFINGHPRVGYAGKYIFIYEGIETVDSSKIDEDFFNHSNYANSLINDLYYIIHNGLRANERAGLLEMPHRNGVYWEVSK